MSTPTANPNQNLTLVGLHSVLYTILAAGAYALDGKISLPTTSRGSSANSAAVMTILQGVTTIYTGQPGDEGFHLTVNAAAGDVLTFTLSSAASVDQDANAVKAVIAIG